MERFNPSQRHNPWTNYQPYFNLDILMADERIHKELRNDVQEIKITMVRIDEGIKRINGSVARHEKEIVNNQRVSNKNALAIAGIRGKIAIVAGSISTIVGGVVAYIFK